MTVLHSSERDAATTVQPLSPTHMNITTSNQPADTNDSAAITTKSRRSRKNERVILPENGIRAILEAAENTGNSQLISVISLTISRSFLAEKRKKPPTPPPPSAPDPNLVAEVQNTYKRINELAKKVSELRENAPTQLKRKIFSERVESVAPHIITDLAEKNESEQLKKDVNAALSVIPPVTKSSVKRFKAVSDGIKKTQYTALDIVRRVGNARTVLKKLREDASNKLDDDYSQTIEADWTVNMNVPSKKKGKRPSTYIPQIMSSPIPRHPPRNSDDFEESALSPYVTPRSKVRRRTARCLGGIPPLRLDMPR